jgi:hypothetical protein
MKKQIFLLIGFLFTAAFAKAQNQYAYYFDKDLNLVNKPSKAIFLGEGAYQNGLFELKVFDKRDKKLLVIEHFNDSSLAQSNGLFVSFLPNGGKGEEGNYLNGRKDGIWRKWWEKGNVIDSSLFDNGEQIMQASFRYYPNGKLFSLIIANVKEGKRVSAYYDEEGNLLPPVIANSKEDPDKIFTKLEVRPSFPGGINSWNHYIAHILQEHFDELRKSSEFGKCLLRFVVKADGSISKIEVLKMKGTELAKIATNAIENGPKWIPGRQNGRKVSAIVLQPVEFDAAQ